MRHSIYGLIIRATLVHLGVFLVFAGILIFACTDVSAATCYGSAYCNACKNCNYCRHCNSGGACGVCQLPISKPEKVSRDFGKDSENSSATKCEDATRYNKSLYDAEELTILKHFLKASGYNVDPSTSTWGDDECNATIAFQKTVSLTPDGKIGPRTLGAMQKIVASADDEKGPNALIESPIPDSTDGVARPSKIPASTEATTYKTKASAPAVAENGDRRGMDNDADGRVEPVYVRGYYRKDGTYVRGHYRALPNR